MLCAGVVHGDLSEFNVLMAADGPVVIDFPQAVDPATNLRRASCSSATSTISCASSAATSEDIARCRMRRRCGSCISRTC
jgi:tRNA A-37 threonylcarbamoyl transferase component Bud32